MDRSSVRVETPSETCLRAAIEEARRSLQEGNHGFGAVIARGGEIVARAHDTEGTAGDSGTHAEIHAIEEAVRVIGKNLRDCILVATREPCPECLKAIAKSGIPRVLCGCRIHAECERGGESRCAENAEVKIVVENGLLSKECAILYDKAVREEIRRLRGAADDQLKEYDRRSCEKRLKWYRQEKNRIDLGEGDSLERGYRLLLRKLGISEEEAPVVYRDEERIVFHSMNVCPTLEACQILGLDTRRVCRLYNEGSTDQLIRQLDPRLRFRRNYERMRPYGECCEEWIELQKAR